MAERKVAFVAGCRVPFARARGIYAELTACDLARMALAGLLRKTHLPPESVDRVIVGSVICHVATSNVAREAALGAGIPETVPASTVTLACISSNLAITAGADLIRSGQADVVIAGGTESLTDIPVGYRKPLRRRLLEAGRAKSPADWVRLLRGLRPPDFLPEIPSIAEYSTGETMGESADKLADAFGVSREEQDRYALASHQRAARARDAGHLGAEIVPAFPPPDCSPFLADDGIREDTSFEALSRLPPAFAKPFGTVTAGNASPLTDGASAVLLMETKSARHLGHTPLATLESYAYVAQDPCEELLLGPAYAIPRVLDANGIALADVDVFELHEAFAGQVLAVQRALDSAHFAEKTGRPKTGAIPEDKMNTWGGSLALGHPFGATGARLVTTAAHRLQVENGNLALVAACAAGGQGHALLMRRWEGAEA